MFSTPPSPPGGYSRPSAPPCLSGYKYSSTHTYGQWEVDNYIAAINRYIGELNDYADEAVQFANTAIAFAKEAERFTNCEARDVKREIE